jgi:hypothetical protein
MKILQLKLKNPSYRVRVFKGVKIVADKNSKEGIYFDDYSLHFF